MSRPNTKKIDRLIADAERKLTAAKNGEMWPLTGSERRRVITALAGGSYKVMRGKSTSRADRKIAALTSEIEGRLGAELAAFRNEKQRIVGEAAAAKVAKKTSGWW
ncbi:hypothetical protein ACFWWT_45280 [Streptomyces sp. NPDC058676]|uniref:hypothetical protein n=1 Tax=unclassified Streptomyces TaxID=2593676 RepID=UPI00365CE33E